MKNIHILPTDKPSKLGYISESQTYHLYNNDIFLDELANAINIYITSDEDIKEGNWYLDTTVNVIFKNDKLFLNGTGYKKIILTTDPTLIVDGVQSIDNEFLEWFVKNSSCEFVEVNKKLVEFPLTFKMMYKITIPQETLEEQMYRASFENESPLWHDGFIAGGKYMTERMYSEEDLRRAYTVGKHGGVNQTYYDFDEWFEQFKKK
jgi:hypothetical protein